jgi:hypothetical protein
MSRYVVEGNINFQDELYKLLNEDSDDEDDSNLCQITGLPLTDTHVTLECKHHFNYIPLYNEIYNQIFIFKTYSPSTLTKHELTKFIEFKPDYYIRCPYCRNIQYAMLPYYDELGLDKIKGINSDKKDPNEQGYYEIWAERHTFKMYGTTFVPGKCDTCAKASYVATIPNTNTKLSYCQHHYKQELKCFKDNLKMQAEKKKQEKIDETNKKKKLLETINEERVAKGLAPLKRLPKQVITQTSDNATSDNATSDNATSDNATSDNVCKSILKTGPNKGNQCGCKNIYSNGFCKRHYICLT